MLFFCGFVQIIALTLYKENMISTDISLEQKPWQYLNVWNITPEDSVHDFLFLLHLYWRSDCPESSDLVELPPCH